MTIRPHASSGRAVRVLAPDTIITRGEAGVIHARSPHALGPYPATITERLDHWAAHAPDRTFLAARGADGQWQRLTYRAAHEQVRRVGQALVSADSRSIAPC